MGRTRDKLTDGKGLQLWIMPNGGKYWRYEYRYLGKRKLLALGTYPGLTLEKARTKATDARREVADNLETARRMRTVIGEVFRFAMQHGIIDGDPSATTKGAVANPKPKHFTAVTDPQRVGGHFAFAFHTVCDLFAAKLKATRTATKI